MEQITPHPIINPGAIARTKKATDFLVGSAVAYDYPSTIMNQIAFGAPIYYQGKRPACGAHAGTWLKMFLNRLHGINPTENDTPRFTWINIKEDGTSPSIGTSLDRIMTVLRNPGVIPFEPLENDVTYDDIDYASVKAVTTAIKNQEKGNVIASYAYPQDQSFSGIKQAINDFGAVIVEIELCERFWTDAQGNTSWAEKDILPLAPPSAAFPVVSSHFVVAHSYDEKYIYFANSFGTEWGMTEHPGHGYFGSNYVPFVTDLGTVIVTKPVEDVPQTSPSNIATVEQALPQVQALVNHLGTLTPEQKQANPSWFTEAENILTGLMSLLTGQ